MDHRLCFFTAVLFFGYVYARSIGLTTLSFDSVLTGPQRDFGATDSLWLVAAPGEDLDGLAATGWGEAQGGGYVLTDTTRTSRARSIWAVSSRSGRLMGGAQNPTFTRVLRKS